MTVKMVSASTANWENGMTSSWYFPPNQLNGVAATTPSILETSPTKEIGTIPANPLAFIVTIRL